MYKVIGGDRKEYGPAELERIEAWLRDGLVDADTKIQKDGGPWVTLASLPEFAVAVRTTSRAARVVHGPATGLFVTGVIGFVSAARRASICSDSRIPRRSWH
jgi:hypothetical protein